MGAAEKMVLWDSWLRGESPKAIGRAFGKPSSVFIASWPPGVASTGWDHRV